MKDQSQIDDMRAAIRGDIERAKARQNGTLVAQREPVPVEAAAQAKPKSTSKPKATSKPRPKPKAKVVPVATPEPEPEALPEPVVEKPRRGFLSSIFKRD